MKQRDDFVRVLIAADERGNLGKSMQGERFYVIVGTLVMRRSEFEDASRHYFDLVGREVKYHDDPKYRKPILIRAAPYIAETYIVKYRKDPGIHNFDGGLTAEEQEARHLSMMERLADRMLKETDADAIDAVIDHSDLVKDYKVRRIFEDNPYANTPHVKCDVRDSASDFALMTNDFVVGAVGANAVNGGDKEAKELVGYLRKKPKEIHLRNKKPRRYRR